MGKSTPLLDENGVQLYSTFSQSQQDTLFNMAAGQIVCAPCPQNLTSSVAVRFEQYGAIVDRLPLTKKVIYKIFLISFFYYKISFSVSSQFLLFEAGIKQRVERGSVISWNQNHCLLT